MNETNLPETRLRSWRPRRPSPSLKRKIFSAAGIEPSLTAWSLRWLGPVTACLFLTVIALHQSRTISDTPDRQVLVGMILSNRIAYVSDRPVHGQNDWTGATFGWTNVGSSTSSIAPFNRAGE